MPSSRSRSNIPSSSAAATCIRCGGVALVERQRPTSSLSIARNGRRNACETVPLSFGVAILRFRLYDIDLIINRTLVYGSLTAMLLGIYLLFVFIGQNLLVSVIGRGSNDGVVLVVSTLAVAALFQPLRHGVQQFVDRRFYRKKYDAAKLLASFSATLHEEINLEQLHTHLLGVIREAMQPAHISLWLCDPVRPAPLADHQAETLEPVLQKTGTS
jgi:hypothetical protein